MKKPWLISSLIAAPIWLAIGTLLVRNYEPEYTKVFIVSWTLCVTNLFFLTKVVFGLIEMMTSQGETKIRSVLSIVIWGTGKFFILGVGIILAIKTRPASPLALGLGVGTLFVVPIVSAIIQKLFVSEKENIKG